MAKGVGLLESGSRFARMPRLASRTWGTRLVARCYGSADQGTHADPSALLRDDKRSICLHPVAG